MTTTERRPEKRLVRCDHPSTEVCECRRAAVDEILARWPTVVAPPPAEQRVREVVDLGEIRPPVVRVPYRQPRQPCDPPPLAIFDDERHGDSLLGAAGAWACVAIAALLMLAFVIRGLWLWIT